MEILFLCYQYAIKSLKSSFSINPLLYFWREKFVSKDESVSFHGDPCIYELLASIHDIFLSFDSSPF